MPQISLEGFSSLTEPSKRYSKVCGARLCASWQHGAGQSRRACHHGLGDKKLMAAAAVEGHPPPSCCCLRLLLDIKAVLLHQALALMLHHWLVPHTHGIALTTHIRICTHPTLQFQCIGRGASKVVYKGFDEQEGIEVAWNEVACSDWVLGR